MNLNNIGVGQRLVIAIGFTVVLILGLSLVAYQTINKLTGEWEQFQSVSLEKFTTAAKGNNKLGDAVHHFKNYLLRGQDYDQQFMADMAEIDRIASSYPLNHGEMSDREQRALEQIRAGAESYRAAMKMAVEMKTSGATIETIDKSIKGADKEIGAALNELQAVTREESAATSTLVAATAIGGKQTIVVICVSAALMAAIFGLWIVRNILLQLGGEPAFAAEIVSRVAEGDLTVKVQTKAGDNSSMLYAIKGMADKLADIVTEVRNNTESISTASREMAQGNTDLSQRTEEQSASLDKTAASMSELSSNVQRNTEAANHANHLAQGTSVVAEQSGESVTKLVATMTAINASSRKIEDIISVIDGIAFQTNILALNAAVEAARAGEQGRGFAVVAGEVRNLAQRSAAAAKEIKLMIGDSVEKVSVGTKQVKDAADEIGDVVTSVQLLASLMKEIAAATTEQNASIERVNQEITLMDAVTQQNAALVEQAAAAAESMQEQAAVLSAAVSTFKLEEITHRDAPKKLYQLKKLV